MEHTFYSTISNQGSDRTEVEESLDSKLLLKLQKLRKIRSMFLLRLHKLTTSWTEPSVTPPKTRYYSTEDAKFLNDAVAHMKLASKSMLHETRMTSA